MESCGTGAAAFYRQRSFPCRRALLFLGIIASGRYGEKQSIALPLNQPKPMFGYELDVHRHIPHTGWKD